MKNSKTLTEKDLFESLSLYEIEEINGGFWKEVGYGLGYAAGVIYDGIIAFGRGAETGSAHRFD